MRKTHWGESRKNLQSEKVHVNIQPVDDWMSFSTKQKTMRTPD